MCDLVKIILSLQRCGDSKTVGIKEIEGMSMLAFFSNIYFLNIWIYRLKMRLKNLLVKAESGN